MAESTIRKSIIDAVRNLLMRYNDEINFRSTHDEDATKKEVDRDMKNVRIVTVPGIGWMVEGMEHGWDWKNRLGVLERKAIGADNFIQASVFRKKYIELFDMSGMANTNPACKSPEALLKYWKALEARSDENEVNKVKEESKVSPNKMPVDMDDLIRRHKKKFGIEDDDDDLEVDEKCRKDAVANNPSNMDELVKRHKQKYGIRDDDMSVDVKAMNKEKEAMKKGISANEAITENEIIKKYSEKMGVPLPVFTKSKILTTGTFTNCPVCHSHAMLPTTYCPFCGFKTMSHEDIREPIEAEPPIDKVIDNIDKVRKEDYDDVLVNGIVNAIDKVRRENDTTDVQDSVEKLKERIESMLAPLDKWLRIALLEKITEDVKDDHITEAIKDKPEEKKRFDPQIFDPLRQTENMERQNLHVPSRSPVDDVAGRDVWGPEGPFDDCVIKENWRDVIKNHVRKNGLGNKNERHWLIADLHHMGVDITEEELEQMFNESQPKWPTEMRTKIHEATRNDIMSATRPSDDDDDTSPYIR